MPKQPAIVFSYKIVQASALILDRDGTIVSMVANSRGQMDSPYYASQLFLYPGIGQLLKPWVQDRVPIFIATNQPGIAKGHFSFEELATCHAALERMLLAEGIPLSGIYACVHHPVGTEGGDRSLVGPCECRKPKPGLIFQLQREHGIDLSRAVFIGDSLVDTQAANAAGVGRALRVRPYLQEPLGPDSILANEFPTLKECLLSLNGEA